MFLIICIVFLLFILCLLISYIFLIIIREPSFCRHLNRADEFLMALPSDVAPKLWGVYKAPTNVLIETEDRRKFIFFRK
ncbi:hypothetical protein Hanom_Chr02g00145971 [Helianthus anomalus]